MRFTTRTECTPQPGPHLEREISHLGTISALEVLNNLFQAHCSLLGYFLKFMIVLMPLQISPSWSTVMLANSHMALDALC